MDWTPDADSLLFRTVCQFKPAGINRHWHMLSMGSYFNTMSPTRVSLADLWARLEELYDLPALDALEFEASPLAEHEFNLNWEDFGEMMLDRAIAVEPSDDETDTFKSLRKHPRVDAKATSSQKTKSSKLQEKISQNKRLSSRGKQRAFQGESNDSIQDKIEEKLSDSENGKIETKNPKFSTDGEEGSDKLRIQPRRRGRVGKTVKKSTNQISQNSENGEGSHQLAQSSKSALQNASTVATKPEENNEFERQHNAVSGRVESDNLKLKNEESTDHLNDNIRERNSSTSGVERADKDMKIDNETKDTYSRKPFNGQRDTYTRSSRTKSKTDARAKHEENSGTRSKKLVTRILESESPKQEKSRKTEDRKPTTKANVKPHTRKKEKEITKCDGRETNNDSDSINREIRTSSRLAAQRSLPSAGINGTSKSQKSSEKTGGLRQKSGVTTSTKRKMPEPAKTSSKRRRR